MSFSALAVKVSVKVAQVSEKIGSLGDRAMASSYLTLEDSVKLVTVFGAAEYLGQYSMV